MFAVIQERQADTHLTSKPWPAAYRESPTSGPHRPQWPVGVGAHGDWLPSRNVAALVKCIAALPCPWSLFISVLIHTNRSMIHVKISVLMD